MRPGRLPGKAAVDLGTKDGLMNLLPSAGEMTGGTLLAAGPPVPAGETVSSGEPPNREGRAPGRTPLISAYGMRSAP